MQGYLTVSSYWNEIQQLRNANRADTEQQEQEGAMMVGLSLEDVFQT